MLERAAPGAAACQGRSSASRRMTAWHPRAAGRFDGLSSQHRPSFRRSRPAMPGSRGSLIGHHHPIACSPAPAAPSQLPGGGWLRQHHLRPLCRQRHPALHPDLHPAGGQRAGVQRLLHRLPRQQRRLPPAALLPAAALRRHPVQPRLRLQRGAPGRGGPRLRPPGPGVPLGGRRPGPAGWRPAGGLPLAGKPGGAPPPSWAGQEGEQCRRPPGQPPGPAHGPAPEGPSQSRPPLTQRPPPCAAQPTACQVFTLTFASPIASPRGNPLAGVCQQGLEYVDESTGAVAWSQASAAPDSCM